MSFSEIFKKGFLDSFNGVDITFGYALTTMLISAVFSSVICIVYYYKAKKYFFSKEFAVSLVALSVVTTAVILTIQSSMVVSLGMVGALSIVRFRSAIKNPLDLCFLFWSIVVGIICGTGLFYIAIILTILLAIILLLYDALPMPGKNKIIVLNGKYPFDKEKLEKIIRQHTRYWNYKTKNIHEGTVNLLIEVKGLKDEDNLIHDIKNETKFDELSIIVQEGVID